MKPTRLTPHTCRLLQVALFAEKAEIPGRVLPPIEAHPFRPRHEVMRRFRHRMAVKFQRIRALTHLTRPPKSPPQFIP